jgi:Domain of unknown function (DUF1707)
MAGEMSSADRGEEAASPDQLRASHEDRDRVVELLQVAAGDGRLTAEELDARLEVALTARTYGDLTALLTDLPGVSGFTAGALVPEPKDVVRIECHTSSATRDGPWVVPPRIDVLVTNGSVTLDFTEAVIVTPSLQIDADMRVGVLKLVTKPGIVVNTDDLAMHTSNVTIRAPWGGPVSLRIDISGTASVSTISAQPPRAPRRTFWQWLRRRPLAQRDHRALI